MTISTLRICCLCLLLPGMQTPSLLRASDVVATVNGEPLRSGELQLEFFLGQLPESATPGERRQLIEQLVDRRLIQQFLQRRKVEPEPRRLEQQVNLITRALERQGEDVEEVLGRLNLTEEALQEILALPIAWNRHVGQVLTESRIREFWEEHRPRYDGTRVRAAQIVKTLERDAPDEEWQAAERTLAELKSRIEAGSLTFAEAAREHSDSPAGERGGDLGEFAWSGRVPEAVSRVAFSLRPGQISDPFRSPFGVHLVRVADLIPGDLGLEDARPEVVRQLSEQLWEEQVRKEREAAEIEILDAGSRQ